jgi:hypothetical protein
VGSDKVGSAAPLPYLLDDLAAPLVVAAGDDHVRPFSGELGRYGPADVAGGAGDQRRLALEA